MQISQESICVGAFFNKVTVLRTATLLKRDSNTGFFLWILRIIQEQLFCRGSMNGWFWNTSCLFKNTFFYRTSPVAASYSFRFPACNFSKKETEAKIFICEFCKIFQEHLLTEHLWILLLVFFCEFWDVFQITSFIEHLWETSYFIYKLPSFNHHIQ